MKYFESGKINVYPAGFRSDDYKQSKLTTEENITHLQNFMSTSDGLYIDYIDYSKNHTSADPSIVQITNKNAGAYFYIAGTEAKVYINSKSEISVNNDYFILRVCGYSFRFKIIDFLDLCLASPSLSGNDVYGYIYLRNSGSGPIGYVLGNVSTSSENVLDQGILFQGLGIGSNSEKEFDACYKVKIGKFNSTNHFTISYDPIQVVNATSDESGNNIKSTYGASIDSTNGNTIILKNKNDVEISRATLTDIAHAESALALDEPPSLSASKNNIIVTAGRRKSIPFTVPYAEKASEDESGNNIQSSYAHSLAATDATYTDDAKIYLKANDDDKTPTLLSDPSLNTVKKSIISKIKNGFLYITKSSKDVKGYNIYTANLYGLDELPVGAFLTVFLPAYNESDKPVKFKLNTSSNPNDSFEEEVYLNGKACSSTNKLSNSSTFYNAYYTGSHWNFTPIGEIISGTSVTLNGTDNQGNYISIYAPTSAGTKEYILKSNGKGAPTWIAQNDLSVGSAKKATNATNDESGNNIRKTYGSSLSVSDATITFTSKYGTELSSVTVDNVQNSLYANKIKTSSKIGDVNNPVYVADDGTVTAGKFIPKLNGSDQTEDTSFYAPTKVGTDKYILKSKGSGAPEWIPQSDLSVGGAKTVYVTAGSGAGTTGYKSIQSVTALPPNPAANTLYIVVEA